MHRRNCGWSRHSNARDGALLLPPPFGERPGAPIMELLLLRAGELDVVCGALAVLETVGTEMPGEASFHTGRWCRWLPVVPHDVFKFGVLDSSR